MNRLHHCKYSEKYVLVAHSPNQHTHTHNCQLSKKKKKTHNCFEFAKIKRCLQCVIIPAK